jgi:hypothetical protein
MSKAASLDPRDTGPQSVSELGPADSVSQHGSRKPSPRTGYPVYRRTYTAHDDQSDWSLDWQSFEADEEYKTSFMAYLALPKTSYLELPDYEQRRFTYTPATAQLTNTVRLYDDLNDRRQLVRAIGWSVYNKSSIPPEHNIYLSVQGRLWAETYLNILDTMCVFSPRWIHVASGDRVQDLDHTLHANLYRELNSLARQYLRRVIPDDRIGHPTVPTYPIMDAHITFNKKQHEVAAVVYRDEVERFLGYVYREMKRNEDKGKGKTIQGFRETVLSHNSTDFDRHPVYVPRAKEPVVEQPLEEEMAQTMEQQVEIYDKITMTPSYAPRYIGRRKSGAYGVIRPTSESPEDYIIRGRTLGDNTPFKSSPFAGGAQWTPGIIEQSDLPTSSRPEVGPSPLSSEPVVVAPVVSQPLRSCLL